MQQPRTPSEIRSLLQSAEREKVIEGLQGVVFQNLREMRPVVDDLAMRHPEKEGRRASLVALLRLEDMDMPPEEAAARQTAVVRAFMALDSRVASEREAAMDAMIQLRVIEFTEEIREKARGSSDERVRKKAQEALEKFASASFEPFMPAMKSRLMMALLTEGAMPEAQGGKEEIRRKLQQGTAKEKEDAISGVADGRLADLLPLVRNLAEDDKEPYGVHYEAIELLKKWKLSKEDEAADVASLWRVLDGHDDRARQLAASFLAKRTRDRRAIEVLVQLLESKDPAAMETAGAALWIVSGKALGCPDSAFSPEKNREIIAKWQEWWRQNRENFKVGGQ